MKRFALLLVPLIALAAPRPSLADPLLRPSVVVEGDVVRLGDLFDNVGDKADTPVARAPAPGKRATVDADWLVRVARIGGVDWHPSSPFDQAVVERAGFTVNARQIEAEILHALANEGVGNNAEVELTNRATQITVPVDMGGAIGVKDLAYDARTRFFAATVEVPADSPSARRLRVQGRVFDTEDVPVLAHALPRGDVLEARDITFVKTRIETLRRDIVTDIDQIIGMAARQPLRNGQMISLSDLEKPLVVRKGAPVTMVLSFGTMTLTAQGRAIEQGSVGDVIRVANTRSNQIVQAKVDGPNRVSVVIAGGVALAN